MNIHAQCQKGVKSKGPHPDDIPDRCERCGEPLTRRTVSERGYRPYVIAFCSNGCLPLTAVEREILELAVDCHDSDPDWTKEEEKR